METISIRFEQDLIKDMKKIMKENRYATKAEFIREAIREKMRNLEKEKELIRLKSAYGSGKKRGRKITDEDIHRAGETAVREIAQQLGVRL